MSQRDWRVLGPLWRDPEACWRQRACDRVRAAATMLVAQAIAKGDLAPKEICERCGTDRRRLVAHHDDYRMPLAVTWLCFSCHQRRHNEIDVAPQLFAIAKALGVQPANKLPYGHIPRALRRGLDI